MLGIENYGSDSDNDSEDVPESNPRTSKSLPAVKLAKKSTLTLNPSSSKLSAELALPPPKAKKGPKKITVGLPVLTRKDEPVDDDANERPAKKPRLQSGAGVSSLLSMLPAPKQKNPVLPTPVRVLGSGVGQPMSLETGRPNISVEESKSTPKMPLRLSAPSLDVFSLGLSLPVGGV
jgi:hypothetical protein